MWGEVFSCMSADWFIGAWNGGACHGGYQGVAYWQMILNWATLNWVTFILFGAPLAALVIIVLVNFVSRIAARV